MSEHRFFLDTSFLQALMSRRDQDHRKALEWYRQVRQAKLVVSTEAVLVEVGNAFGKIDRRLGAQIIESYLESSQDLESNIEVVPVDTEILRRALKLYRSHQDKEWGLTDCISFVIMRERGIEKALTADHHFVQAGFRALLRE